MNTVKSDFVSSDEIVEALRNVYEKYGRNFVLYSVSDNIRYTKTELQKEISKLDARLKEAKSEVFIEPIIEANDNDFDIVPQGFHLYQEIYIIC